MTSPAASDDRFRIKIQLHCGGEIALGPGKADLLDAIAREGSISAAGRALGMSYRRSWALVDVMNHCWSGPLVETVMGGRNGGGARLTELGQAILTQYRTLQAQIDACARTGEASEQLFAALRLTPLIPT